MPKILLSVSHLTQRTQSDCLVTCVQMVTEYLQHPLPYVEIFNLLGTRWYGTPFRHVERLAQAGFTVSLVNFDLTEIQKSLLQGHPVLVGVNTADLSYWTQAVDHVVVVVGMDDDAFYINDPASSDGQQRISLDELALAQLAFDNLGAVIKRE